MAKLPLLLVLIPVLAVSAQELRWTGSVQGFEHQDVFRVAALPGEADHSTLIGFGVDDAAWPKFRAPADWKEGPFPGHDGKVVYRLRLVFDEVPSEAPGVFLGNGIDNDWTYFNGRLIGHNGRVGSNTTTHAFDTYRLYALPPDSIVSGENLLAIVVKNHRYEAGMLGGPYLFGPVLSLWQRIQTENAVVIGLLSIYTLVGLTFLFLALKYPKERVNWAFTAFLLGITVYFFTRSQLKYEITNDFMFWESIEMFSFSLVPPLFFFFLLSFFGERHRLHHGVIYGMAGVLVVLYATLSQNLHWGSVLLAWTTLTWLILALFVVQMLIKKFRSHLDGRPIFFCTMAMMLAIFYDVLADCVVLGLGNRVCIAMYAFAAFILTLSWIQASRYARMFNNLELVVAEKTASLRQANEDLTKLATRDQLTGLLNRPEWERLLGGEYNRYCRYHPKRPFCVLFIDMDYFKDVNDTYGHQAGDELLRCVGGILSTILRSVDISARFGGDEFVILLPETAEEEAKIVARKILTAVDRAWEERYARFLAETGRPLPKGHRIGLSVGIAESHVGTHTSPDDILVMADKALYQAKESGRGQFIVAMD